MSSEEFQHIRWFRNSAPYINAHRGRTFVIVFSGEAALHANFPNIIHDIALLQSLGVRLVLIHGARPQIARRMSAAGLEGRFHEGVRITDTTELAYVKDACGSLRADIEALLSTGLPNSPMQGASISVTGGNFVTAQPIGVVDGVDFQHTGRVRRVSDRAIRQQARCGRPLPDALRSGPSASSSTPDVLFCCRLWAIHPPARFLTWRWKISPCIPLPRSALRSCCYWVLPGGYMTATS